MKIGHALAATLLALLAAASCGRRLTTGSSSDRATVAVDSMAPAGDDLGVMNFAVDTRPVSAQVDLFARLRYAGVAFFHSFQPDTVAEFAAQPAVASGRVPIVAVLLMVDGANLDREGLKQAIVSIVRAGSVPWLLVDNSATLRQEQVVEVVREAADMAAAIHGGGGVSLVLYPHAGHFMASAEIALAVLQEAGRGNVALSLHLCHELKAGNRDRLADVITRVAPYVALASIHGADRDSETPVHDWSRTILPLAEGDLDVEKLYLRPLLDAHYQGPVLLHTYGLNQAPEAHLKESRVRWRHMIAAWSASK